MVVFIILRKWTQRPFATRGMHTSGIGRIRFRARSFSHGGLKSSKRQWNWIKRKDLSICHHLTTTIQCLKCQVSHPVVLVFSCQPGSTARGVHNPPLLSSQHSENMRKSILAESGVKLVAGVFCFKFIEVKAPDWVKFNRIMYGKFTLLWWKRHSWLERVI